MKLYRLKPSDFHKCYSIKDVDYEFYEAFRSVDELKTNWEKSELKKVGGGKNAKVLFCFDPKGILIEEEMLPIFQKQLENENVEFLPLSDGKKTWYILHCCELADVKHITDDSVRGQLHKYYLDKDEFVNGNYDDKNVFKLLGRGVKDIIEEELYTEKMVDFINGFENVGICFEEAGGVIEE